jgi:hypothetical protein
MDQDSTDPVSALCELAEASGDRFRATALIGRYGTSLRLLTDLGAIEAGAPLRTVTCHACHGDHPATVEFDAATRRHSHFCPEAGLVTVDDADLATLQFNPLWLVEWLVRELPIIAPIRRRALVPGRVWHLGDARCGEALLTVVLARQVSSQGDLDLLASALGTLPPADLGVVATSSADVAQRVALPHGYRFLDLREVVRTKEYQLTLDSAKLGSWVKATRSGTAKRAQSRSGRPSEKALVEQFYNERRSRGIPMVNISAEARDIEVEFSKRFPDKAPPHQATIRKHMPRLTT